MNLWDLFEKISETSNLAYVNDGGTVNNFERVWGPSEVRKKKYLKFSNEGRVIEF